ncbi:3-hydroxyacyl-CoA dehydrogenase [Microbacterium sp. SORGH_AS_0888]|uniref:3-hydroxyacyl-CoA dehydrogenase n=1 Tax=Microbacterium sp. SORGH_AS_0888 TaxID=3041791 RepID=UPI00277E2FD7|nr:3-hydroxyacyl-CoA dehydrogenase [Microbacterium sp. SORGH_AS_0888]MDQ1129186.1 3-hydroxyacyl-CoA dehydrogenase [Microbacterium sp. SORGH_AS_0888]
MNTFTTVTVLGTGVLGSQIAFQTAYAGFDVVAWDVDDAAIASARARFAELAKTYAAEVAGAADGRADAALERIRTTTDLADATADADLVIEAVPENPEIKKDVWARVGAAAPAKTIFATNSSTLLPSAFMDASGRPDRFLALHYANHIWAQNTAEIMGTPKTSPEVYARVVAFAKEQGMVPIELKKEQPGYVLNSLLVPLLNAASALWVDDVADIETIDKTWRIGTGAPLGPFQIFDIVGLVTAYNISLMGDETSRRFAARLKSEYLDQGKLGTSSGAGFYTYPQK